MTRQISLYDTADLLHRVMQDLDYTSHSKEEVVMENRFLVERLLTIHNFTQDTLNQLGVLDRKGA